ncbi:MAG: hypothetical protein H7X99_08775 [Saprospiraceae bacterium]|nr:hypothetical protein [Saprospiraceae bacterium]
MDQYLIYFIIIPLLGLLISFLPSKTKETQIYRIALTTLLIQLGGTLLFSFALLLSAQEPFYTQLFTYYHEGDSHLTFDLFFDGLTMVYSLVSCILGIFVIIFSRYYMHRDRGYKRFFNNIIFFFLGLNFVIFSGNFESLFVGWEILGISSFFLIGYYRLRYLPVKNAMKVVSLYRFSDMCLLIAVWLCHLAFNKNINFIELNNTSGWAEQLSENPFFFYLIPFIFLTVASVKSAQLPFSSWLPRAMEGPTTSTAIFYGSLSVHIGIFLLLRVEPLWTDNVTFKLLLGILGLSTSLVATSIASVQSSVKTQIAYSSVAQIGIMFIEIALGLDKLALIHFAGNAFLRAYQLLVSPSVLHYLIHDQYYNFETPKDRSWFGSDHKIRSTIFILSIKEWSLDRFHFKILWLPFKFFGNLFRFLSSRLAFIGVSLVMITGFYLFYSGMSDAFKESSSIIAFGFAISSFLLVLQAFTERDSAIRAWLYLVAGQLFIILSTGFNGTLSTKESFIYLSGVCISGAVGYYCLNRMRKLENILDLHGYYGHIYEHPKLGLAFLFSGLGLAGFPITPTFIGLDIVFSNISGTQYLLPVILAGSLLFLEISAIRMYSRIFLGPHVKQYHPVAFRSS